MAQPPPPRWELEREVWLACAGPYARLPATGSRVYYFPRGHVDQCRGAHLPVQPDEALPCTVSAVELFYHAAIDDPYAIITLLPNDGQGQAQPSDHQANPTGSRSAAYFVKQLSSENNKEALDVPKDCAESLLLNLNHNTEKQTLHLLDMQRKELQFGHSGDDRLTTGWDQYFRDKQLMLRLDAVVFIRSANDQLLIGPRRSLWSEHHAREQVQDVMGAAAARVAGGPFRVTYYPRQGWDFVVPTEEVDTADARNIDWQPGMKVRMVCPVDDHELESSRAQRRNSYEGTVTAVNNTTWCKLEIDWKTGFRSSPKPWIADIPARQVNVWRVELQGDSSPGKKRKTTQSHNSAAGHRSKKSKVPRA
ncbi:auxin response factor 13-like [Brachypodium distachyon]|uniref:Uncharacterized protein n=1 Tax=Brachypodium distachyon TaxID=15368 RepID=A0A2K2DJ53_BRADI|nr:auxin response factor 13-like [Brachypodium distachyon]PNT74312.1 hypothetical protein BRADI_1g12476v3 [Brachypodium distachyon]|eukprot:XP_010229511.1 auxin response factor 13-like [Brachypodium distachyon]